jgi:hypothetical protein
MDAPSPSRLPLLRIIMVSFLLRLATGLTREYEAAAYMADMLMEIAPQFEAAHFSQIRRHYESLEPEPDDNPGQ